jgi:hypothetical protein
MMSAFRTSRSVWKVVAAILTLLLLMVSISPAAEKIDVCGQATAEQLAILSRKPLYATAQENGCFWSRTPGAMAYLHISLQEQSKPLREYFNKDLSATTRLEAVTDLGDEGLMSVVEGSLGVIVIRKGKRVLVSAATFLDIESGSAKQRVLWDIYRHILDQI